MTKVKKNKLALWTASLCAFGMVVGLAACAPQNNANDATDQKTEDKPVVEQVETPEADSFGVVVADSWKDIYPNQYNTYQDNAANSPDSGKHNYLELYPALNTMYKGYAFALGYDEASSHLYTLKSVSESPRTTQKEQSANCITCKTPQFTRLVAENGDSVYAQKFNDTIGEFDEPISCYNCHENDPTTLNVTGQYFVKSLGKDYGENSSVPMSAQVCGQCHNEYYFNKDKVTSNPYEGLDQMTPEKMLAFYDEQGFKDWNHAETFAPMIKVQHPEFETMYGGKGSVMAKQGYSCADCHMGTETAADGTEYTSHNWISPLENKKLLEDDCSKCHKDLAKEVKDIQDEEETRVTAISEKIEDMTHKIAEKYADEIAAMKAANEAKTDIPAASEELAKLQNLQRTAQFYWDFVMVENSEGAHNSELTFDTLDKAEAAVDEALSMLA